MSKKYKLCVNGNYTVEAALIFPLVIFIIVGLIYLAFYLHDLGKVQAILYEGQIRAKGLINNETDINDKILSYDNYIDRTCFYPIDNKFRKKEDEIKKYIEKKSKNTLIISNVRNINVKANAFSVSLEAEVDFEFPFKIVQEFFKGNENTVVKSNEYIHSPTSLIRGYEVASSVGRKVDIIKIVNEKQKKLFELIK